MLDWIASPLRRRLLLHIKNRGSLSLDDAMDVLDRARSTVRDHLVALEERGLVRADAEPTEGRGRPRHRYRLTSSAHALFPSRDGELMRELIGFLDDQGASDLVEAFFERFWRERTERVTARLQSADDVDERLAVIESVLREEGFMPEVDASEDAVVIRECNCPFPESVKQTRLPCRLERAFFETLLQRPATRTSYLPDGHDACTYTFAPSPPASDAPS